MTNEEMKVLKFKTMIDDLYGKMEETPIYFDKAKTPRPGALSGSLPDTVLASGVEVLLGNGDKNPYLKIIIRKPRSGMERAVDIIFEGLGNSAAQNHSCSSSRRGLAPSIENLILASKSCQKCEHAYASCSMPSQTIFFALIALAIDEELYKEQLEVVSDAAYMMGFNEAMIEDWTTVVKKILMAEEIDSGQLKTEEAKKFFAFFKNN